MYSICCADVSCTGRVASPHRFGDRQDLVRFDVGEGLLHAGGPAKLYLLEYSVIGEPEVNPLIAGGVVADSGGDLVVLVAVRGSDLNLRADTIAVVLDADELEQIQ